MKVYADGSYIPPEDLFFSNSRLLLFEADETDPRFPVLGGECFTLPIFVGSETLPIGGTN